MPLPKTLVLYKKSSFSIYFQRKQSSLNKRAIAPSELRRFKRTHQNHERCLKIVEDVLTKYAVPFVKRHRGGKIDYEQFDLVITVGGDGTFLEAARGITRQNILGVNSDPAWSVGRFCCANAMNFENVIKKFLDNKVNIMKFPRLKLTVKGHTVHVLNEILICHHNPGAMSRYYLTVGKIKEEQKSSGVWISTAAGSSGAIRSAGGRKIDPQWRRMQYKPRELYSGKGNVYRLRGGVLAANERISVTSLIREGFVFVDGSHVCFPFDFGETIKIGWSLFPLCVVSCR